MSFKLIPRVLLVKNLTPAQKLVLLVIANYANDRGKNCWASHSTVAEAVGVTPRHIIRIINSLEERGLVRRRGYDSRYSTRVLDVNLFALPVTPASRDKGVRVTPESNYLRPQSHITPDTQVIQTNIEPTRNLQVQVDRYSSVSRPYTDGVQALDETDQEFRHRMSRKMGQ
jgi:DNA-binding Lrp family transcriptional regulator